MRRMFFFSFEKTYTSKRINNGEPATRTCNISHLLVKLRRYEKSKRVAVTGKGENRGNVGGNEDCGMSGTLCDWLVSWLAGSLNVAFHGYLYIQVLKRRPKKRSHLPSYPHYHAPKQTHGCIADKHMSIFLSLP